jgi:phosphonate transport system ATP-binding protein
VGRRVRAALDKVGLLNREKAFPISLSGGEQQRVGIARALMQEPKIILADEPVASLDPATSERILGMLHRICREDDLTAVVSLHQVELARMFADRIIGLADGHVVFDSVADKFNDDVYHRIYENRNEEKICQTGISN